MEGVVRKLHHLLASTAEVALLVAACGTEETTTAAFPRRSAELRLPR
jgi:nitrous oxide reductase accessory protein NosL